MNVLRHPITAADDFHSFGSDSKEVLNRECFCISIDAPKISEAIIAKEGGAPHSRIEITTTGSACESIFPRPSHAIEAACAGAPFIDNQSVAISEIPPPIPSASRRRLN